MLEKNLSNNSRAFIILLDKINEREQILLIDRFVRKKTLKEVAKEYGVTDSTIKNQEDELILRIEQTFDFINI